MQGIDKVIFFELKTIPPSHAYILVAANNICYDLVAISPCNKENKTRRAPGGVTNLLLPSTFDIVDTALSFFLTTQQQQQPQ